MSLDAYRDSSMLELFRQEAQMQTQVMDTGLLVLEREPNDPAQLEACMRAAHSLKGAARIVGLDAAVALTHVMEDLLVAAQNGEVRLNTTHIDALLRSSDALRQLSEGVHVDGLPALQALLATDAQPQAEPPPTPVVQELPSPMLTPAFYAESAPPEASDPELPAEQHDRILRVSADRLDQLLDLAGRSLVAAQRTKPLSQGLTRLKRMQDQIDRSLHGLRDALLGHELPPRAKAMLTDASHWTLEAKNLLQHHTETFDNF
ncbi:MAG: Hpt domain-containing protein, partial [Comamonas sp.]